MIYKKGQDKGSSQSQISLKVEVRMGAQVGGLHGVTPAIEWVSWVETRQETHSNHSVETKEGLSPSQEEEPGFELGRP